MSNLNQSVYEKQSLREMNITTKCVFSWAHKLFTSDYQRYFIHITYFSQSVLDHVGDQNMPPQNAFSIRLALI